MKRKIITMESILILLLFVSQVFTPFAQNSETPVRVIEIKDLGLSESDESKSVYEIRWEMKPTLHPNNSVFNVTLEITYADGAILIFDKQVEYSARSTRIEVPSLHIFRGKKPATVKETKAFVTAESK